MSKSKTLLLGTGEKLYASLSLVNIHFVLKKIHHVVPKLHSWPGVFSEHREGKQSSLL